MSNFKNFTLNIPSLWEQDWSEAISHNVDAARILVVFQARAANMLRDIDQIEATPERVAWLSIWMKTFAALENAQAALERSSLYLLRILSRIAFEANLHMEIISEPAIQLFSKVRVSHKVTITDRSRRYVWSETADRLRGYTAWCLWNDRDYYKELLNRRTLNGVWDPDPARQILADKDKLRRYEAIFGPLDVATEKRELEKGREHAEKHFRKKLKRVEVWLEDPSLLRWKDKLQRLECSKKRPVPFFDLFHDESTRSIPKRLKDIGLRFAYCTYMQGSMLIHGSTIDQLLHVGESEIYPSFLGTHDACESEARSVGDSCNNTLALLYCLQERVWDYRTDC